MKDWFRRLKGASFAQRIFPICLVLGVLFLVLSNTHRNKPDEVKETGREVSVTYEARLEERLAQTLSMMKGVGRVEVMITCMDQGTVQVEKDTSYNRSETTEEDGDGGRRVVLQETEDEEVVFDASSEPFVSRRQTPSVQGVLVLAEGAESSLIKEQLIQSVSVLLHIKVSQIQVLPYQN